MCLTLPTLLEMGIFRRLTLVRIDQAFDADDLIARLYTIRNTTPPIAIEHKRTTASAYTVMELENHASGILCRMTNAARVIGELRTKLETIAAVTPARALLKNTLNFTYDSPLERRYEQFGPRVGMMSVTEIFHPQPISDRLDVRSLAMIGHMHPWLSPAAYILLGACNLCFGFYFYSLSRNKSRQSKGTRTSAVLLFVGTFVFGLLGFLAWMKQ